LSTIDDIQWSAGLSNCKRVVSASRGAEHEVGFDRSMTTDQPIERKSVAEQVYGRLRADILSGRIALGARVVESQIAARFKTSRAPVREAVQRLVQDGLLEAKPHQGPSVVTLTKTDIRQLYEARAAIESRAVAALCAQRNPDHIVLLEQQIEEMRKASRERNFDALVGSELEFHLMLCQLSANVYLLRMGEILQDQVRLALNIDNANYNKLSDIAEEHVNLVEAIRLGDAQEALKELEAHIFDSIEIIF